MISRNQWFDKSVTKSSDAFQVGDVKLTIELAYYEKMGRSYLDLYTLIDKERVVFYDLKWELEYRYRHKDINDIVMVDTRRQCHDEFMDHSTLDEVNLKNESLIIQYDIKVYENTQDILRLKTKESNIDTSCNRNLQYDMGMALKENDDKDFVIQCQDKYFSCHRFILKIRSPVFKAMLESDNTESTNGVLVIVDFDKEVVQSFLEYLYTDKCSDLTALAEDLLIIADKYDVQGLVAMAMNELGKNINEENVPGYLMTASRLQNGQKFFDKLVTYIKNNMELVKQSPGWQVLVEKDPELLANFV